MTKQTRKRRKTVSLPEKLVYFRCKNQDCGFVGAGVTTKPYIRCSRCNQWSSVFKQQISADEYRAVWSSNGRRT